MPVYKNKENGTWFCKFYYRDWQGARKQKWKRGFSTKKEAQRFERDFLEQQADSPDITFGNLYQAYLREMAVRLKPSTIIIKKNICETKILPFFEDRIVSEITAADIRKWQDELMRSPKKYSGTYLKTVNNQLTAMIHYAMKYYNLRTNPCEQAGSIGVSRAEEMQYWTLNEFLRFQKGMKEPSVRLCFEILYWTGLRVGEMLALTPKDIDRERKEIRVDKSYQRLQGKDVITAPKTRQSRRWVAMPDFLCRELARYIRGLPDGDDTARIFPYTRTYLNNEMKRCCERTGVKKIRIHDLRHSHVSLLIDQGYDALLIAERVGHKQVSTTLNTYAHLFPNRQTELASSLDRLKRDRTLNDSKRVAEDEKES